MKTTLRFSGTIITASICHLLGACTPKPVTVQTHEKDGLQFSYNSDWSVTEDAPIEGAPDKRSIQIEGPDSALVCMICLPTTNPKTLETFAGTIAGNRAKAMDKKMSVGSLQVANVNVGTSEATTGNVSGHQEKGIHQHFSINMLGNEIPHDATFFSIQGTKYKVMIMTQVAEENSEASRPAINLILNSLKIDGQ